MKTDVNPKIVDVFFTTGYVLGQKVDAKKVRERLKSLIVKHGQVLQAEDVLEDAKSKSSPLHPIFEWNDGVAAERWRRHQALNLVGSIKVTIERPDGTIGETRAFVRVRVHEEVPKDDGGSRYAYVTLERTMTEEDLREQAIDQALREWKAWKDRWSFLKELAFLFEAGAMIEEKKRRTA